MLGMSWSAPKTRRRLKTRSSAEWSHGEWGGVGERGKEGL